MGRGNMDLEKTMMSMEAATMAFTEQLDSEINGLSVTPISPEMRELSALFRTQLRTIAVTAFRSGYLKGVREMVEQLAEQGKPANIVQ